MDYQRVLVLHFTNGMSIREIAYTIVCGKTIIIEFLKRFQSCAALRYPLPEDVTYEFIMPAKGKISPVNTQCGGSC